jgi:2,5-furandicarboxylate decarboxylase 1
VRIGNNGVHAKLGIDATVPFNDKARFQRAKFEDVTVDAKNLSLDAAAIRKRLGF